MPASPTVVELIHSSNDIGPKLIPESAEQSFVIGQSDAYRRASNLAVRHHQKLVRASRDTNHKELIQVRAKDAQKLDAF